MNLNLSKFHKVETDDHATTLYHPSGHTIKIARKGLSDDLKKQLDDLPTKMAKGGDVPSKPSKSSNTMPGSPTEAKNNYTEPDALGTHIPPRQMQAQTNGQEPYKDVVLNAMKREAPPFGPLGMDQKQHFPPCLNSSCKSFGVSHPNCRCYGGNSQVGMGEGRFAEGGEVESYCASDRPHMEGCEYFAEGGMPTEEIPVEEPPVETMVAEKPTLAPQVPAPQPEAPAAPMPQETEVAQQPVNPNPEMNRAPAQETKLQQFTNKKQQDSQQLQQEAQTFQADLDAGHIKPETYQSLFAKKDTLGKIGTLFGLLLSGAGSGLTGQPDALLGMMNKQIANDLEAQQKSVANQQNFLKINQENLMNAAGVKQMNQETAQKAWALTRAQMNNAALHQLVTQTNKLPPGPQKDQAMQTLSMMNQTVQNENFDILDRAATGAAFYNTLFGQPSAGASEVPEEQFKKQQMGRRALGPEGEKIANIMEDRHIPGIEGQSSMPVPQQAREEVQAMKILSDKAQDLMQYSKENWATLSPSKRKVAAQKAEEMVNYYNNSIKGGVLTEGRLKWLDQQISKNPTGIVTQLLGNNARLKEIKDSNDHRMGIVLDTYGFPKSKGAKSAAPAGQETIERMDPKSGKIVVYDAKTKKPLRFK